MFVANSWWQVVRLQPSLSQRAWTMWAIAKVCSPRSSRATINLSSGSAVEFIPRPAQQRLPVELLSVLERGVRCGPRYLDVDHAHAVDHSGLRGIDRSKTCMHWSRPSWNVSILKSPGAKFALATSSLFPYRTEVRRHVAQPVWPPSDWERQQLSYQTRWQEKP